MPSQNLSIYYNQILNANFSTFYLLGFFQHKKQSLLIESCHLYAYIINPMRKKKKCTTLLGLFWGLEGPGYFLFSVSVFVHRLFTIAPRQGQWVWGWGAVFGM